MLFWTQEEYQKFAFAVMDKPVSYYAFEMLYWCGIRLGELLALTYGDFDFVKQTVRINKSYQCIKGKDVVTTPKTKKSNRTIVMPDFLCDEMQRYFKGLYKPKKNDRVFLITKAYLHSEMRRGCKETGVKRIRIHDLRHSHVSLLIDMGFTPLAGIPKTLAISLHILVSVLTYCSFIGTNISVPVAVPPALFK